MACRIKDLESEVLCLKQSASAWDSEKKISADFDYEIQILKSRLGYKDGLIALKDNMLEIASREHLRFMQLYIDQHDEMTTLRQTNETLVKKILKLEIPVFNPRICFVAPEKKPLGQACKDQSLFSAPAAVCKFRAHRSIKSCTNAAASLTDSAGTSA
jgi:hypothetical protein